MIFLISIGFLLISFFLSYRLKSKFKKYSQIPLRSGISGAEAAAEMLRDHRIYDVQIMCVGGELSDHYNPADKTVNLSYDVYHGRNAAAVAVATHECGHAVQHATAYSWLEFRTMMVPVQNISAKILNILFWISILGGIMMLGLPMKLVLTILVVAYGIITLFSLITLPVEFDASKRALAWVQDRRLTTPDEFEMSKDALHWAAMTYVVGAVSSIVTFLYYALQLVGISDD
jgi:uncharacterized protein